MYYTQGRLEQCYQPETSTRLEYETIAYRKVWTIEYSPVYIALCPKRTAMYIPYPTLPIVYPLS